MSSALVLPDTQAQSKADLPQPTEQPLFDFSDLGGKMIHNTKTQGDYDTFVQKQKDDAIAENDLYRTDPQSYKQKHPIDYMTRKAHDFVTNAVTESTMRNIPNELKAGTEPKVRALVNAGVSAYGMPSGEETGDVLASTLPGKGLDPEEIEAIGGRTISKATPQATVSAGGSGALSSEELARPETFVKYNRSMQPTHLGKQPDATLKPGEAVMAINTKTGKVRVQNTEGLSDSDAMNRFEQHMKTNFGPKKKLDRTPPPVVPSSGSSINGL